MIGIYDKSTVQATVKWKIKDKDILSGNKKITYISPGGFKMCNKDEENEISIDWLDSASSINDNIISAELFSLDMELMNDSLQEQESEHLVKERYDINFFNDFSDVKEAYCFIDVDSMEYEAELECIYLEIHDPISKEGIILIDKEV